MKHIIEGFVEIIGLLPFALILRLLETQINSNLLPAIAAFFVVYIIIAIVVVKEKFIESVKNRKAVAIKAVGWIIALIIIIFAFSNPLFSKSEVIPETIIWLVVVGLGNLITYYKNRR